MGDEGGEEEVAIGNTLKTMEAKEAVEEELESEVAINCDVSEWGPYGKCNVACDGGKQNALAKSKGNHRTVVPHVQSSKRKSSATLSHVRARLTRGVPLAASSLPQRKSANRSKTVNIFAVQCQQPLCMT